MSFKGISRTQLLAILQKLPVNVTVIRDNLRASLAAEPTEEIESGWTISASFIRLYEPVSDTRAWIAHDQNYPFDFYVKKAGEAGRNPIYYSYLEDKLWIMAALGIATIEPEIVRTSPTVFDLLFQSSIASNRGFIFQLHNGVSYVDALRMNYDVGMVIQDDIPLGIGKDSDGMLPTPSAAYRGKMIRVEGGAGVADSLYMCMKSAADTYSWVLIASG